MGSSYLWVGVLLTALLAGPVHAVTNSLGAGMFLAAKAEQGCPSSCPYATGVCCGGLSTCCPQQTVCVPATDNSPQLCAPHVSSATQANVNLYLGEQPHANNMSQALRSLLTPPPTPNVGEIVAEAVKKHQQEQEHKKRLHQLLKKRHQLIKREHEHKKGQQQEQTLKLQVKQVMQAKQQEMLHPTTTTPPPKPAADKVKVVFKDVVNHELDQASLAEHLAQKHLSKASQTAVLRVQRANRISQQLMRDGNSLNSLIHKTLKIPRAQPSEAIRQSSMITREKMEAARNPPQQPGQPVVTNSNQPDGVSTHRLHMATRDKYPYIPVTQGTMDKIVNRLQLQLAHDKHLLSTSRISDEELTKRFELARRGPKEGFILAGGSSEESAGFHPGGGSSEESAAGGAGASGGSRGDEPRFVGKRSAAAGGNKADTADDLSGAEDLQAADEAGANADAADAAAVVAEAARAVAAEEGEESGANDSAAAAAAEDSSNTNEDAAELSAP